MRLTDARDPHLEAVCSGRVGTVGSGTRAHRSAFHKRPVPGRVTVDERGLPDDEVGDTADHGGVDQALYAYAEHDARWWAGALGRELPAGSFGENLRTVGIDPNGARIGARWRIGPEVEVEVTGPRLPCATLTAAWDEAGIVERFLRAGRLGAYLRVTRPGRLTADDPIEVLDASPPGTLSVAEVATIRTRERHRAPELLEVAGLGHRHLQWAARAAASRA